MEEDKALEEHLQFIEEENFGANIFDEKSRLLKIIIAPITLPTEKINFKEKINWLQNNMHPEIPKSWKPFLQGARTVARSTKMIEGNGQKEEKEIPLSIALLFHNATVSFCCKLEQDVKGKTEIHLGYITEDIKSVLNFTSRFYKELKFLDPVKIYLQLVNVNGLPANLDLNSFINKGWDFLSKEFERKWHDRELKFEENSSGKEIAENPISVAKKVSERLVQAFGVWEVPPRYFGQP